MILSCNPSPLILFVSWACYVIYKGETPMIRSNGSEKCWRIHSWKMYIAIVYAFIHIYDSYESGSRPLYQCRRYQLKCVFLRILIPFLRHRYDGKGHTLKDYWNVSHKKAKGTKRPKLNLERTYNLRRKNSLDAYDSVSSLKLLVQCTRLYLYPLL